MFNLGITLELNTLGAALIYEERISKTDSRLSQIVLLIRLHTMLEIFDIPRNSSAPNVISSCYISIGVASRL